MTDATDIYVAVLADPFDMDLRLRYADIDPDHAELIRLQISLDLAGIAGTGGSPVGGPPADPGAAGGRGSARFASVIRIA